LDDDLPNLELEQENYKTIMAKMFKEAWKLLYEGCPISRLIAILLLLNLVTTHGVNNTFVDELFTLLRVDLFPKDNTFSKSLYFAKRVVFNN
jgi:hypothetical protein